MNDLSFLLFLCTAAYGFHVMEEFIFNWQSWARNVLHLPAEWKDFYVTNVLVILLGLVGAFIAPRYPAIALGFPALMIINAIFFHIGPFLFTRGRFSPGLITAVALFLPIGFASFRAAHLDAFQLTVAMIVGALTMASPIVFLKLATLPYFNQDR